MKLKKVNCDPFSNGTEQMMFEDICCSRCVKWSYPIDDGKRYINATEDNMPKCSIQRDICLRMFSNDPIKQETIDVCRDFVMRGTICPYQKTKHKVVKQQPKNQTKLF